MIRIWMAFFFELNLNTKGENMNVQASYHTTFD